MIFSHKINIGKCEVSREWLNKKNQGENCTDGHARRNYLRVTDIPAFSPLPYGRLNMICYNNNAMENETHSFPRNDLRDR